jgi:hypothetical protein
MKKEKKKTVISDIKTVCCNAGWYIRSRANYRCEKCNDDVTLHIVSVQMMLDEDSKTQK